MAATRVYILAKELGVKSAAIVEKCQAEGLDQITNHMSTISAGLTATIKEWFSENENITTVETSEKVDLKKVRVKRKKPAKKTEEAAAQTESEEQAAPEVKGVEVIEKPSEAPPLDKVKETKEHEKPKKPERIVPAGPKLEKPKPAKLSGPTVVRVESLETPRPRPKPKPRERTRFETKVTEPLIPQTEAPVKGKYKGKGKDRTHGRRHEADLEGRKVPLAGPRRLRDLEERQARLTAALGEGLRTRPSRKIATKKDASPSQAFLRPEKITVSEPVHVKDLAAALGVKVSDVIAQLMRQGTMATANQAIGNDVAELIALESGIELVVERKKLLEEDIEKEFAERERKNLAKRPVVATMLGHVDHGKTSLLDRIRSTQVTAGEAGGITQHIGAYQVVINDKKITFLDTPGHEAFTAMRARGANMTDVVVLVVAADDGVMPQTIEAIHHAKAAGVPIVVALNKSDLPGCNFNKVYSQLAEHALAPVDWGGNSEVIKTSATTGMGISELLEHIDFAAELLDLKSDDTVPAMGWVVEAKMSAQRGATATLLLKEGQLNKGDIILAGTGYGRIKALRDSFGRTIKKAISSMPVEVTGLSRVPQAGDKFYVLDNINLAKQAAEENESISREGTLARKTQVTLDNLFSQIEAGNVKDLNIIIRADVQGSVDVLTKYLSELSTEEVKINILHAAPGGITEGDVVLAEASNAIIIGFNVIAEDHVAKLAESKGVDIRFYSIIYRITEDLKKSMVGLLEPEEKEEHLGRATIRNTFKVSRLGTIAGCYVTEGVIRKNAKVRLIRNNVVVRGDLSIESLKHFKDDAREVKAGLECGIKVAKYDDVKVDDMLDFYQIISVARTLG
ncbi:MAG: translation initiation factor IF-2 [Phycisphaerae bacterium]|nr:translation initiation factor IF-2 [Phycisphaerae bacterium]